MRTFAFDPKSQYLFNRVYSVALGPPNQVSAIEYGTQGNPASPIRVRFNIDKNIFGSSPNHSVIDLFNISAKTAQSIKKGYLVRLDAGYNTLAKAVNPTNLLKTIFTGSVFFAKIERSNAEIITSLECLDGGGSIIMATFDKSYGPNTPLIQILQDAAKAMHVDTTQSPDGVDAGTVVNVPNVIIPNSFVAHGPVRDTLDKLLKPMALEWSVQNNALNIIPKNGFNGQSAILISKDTGMIGNPSSLVDCVQFKALLNPNLVPGQLVQIEENIKDQNGTQFRSFKGLSGLYKIRRSKFEGDSHEQSWHVTCECNAFDSGVTTVSAAQGFNYNTAVT